jgi:sterol desaturase/sphingolipid hydroxylase (fatty acid hydroxylase superfamily)
MTMTAPDPHLATLFLSVLGITGARYLLFAGGAWLVAYVVFWRRWAPRKIIARLPQASDVWWEVRHSALTIVVFAIIGTLTVIAVQHGMTPMYWTIGERGWIWFWASLALAIVIHDAYFYWTHRLMHRPGVFRMVHRTHHHSRNPSPWAAYSFSPLEAVVEAGIFPLLVLSMPIHPAMLSLFMLWQIIFNVVGHTGFEYHPQRFMDSRLRFLFNTPTNHILHHESIRGNFGLYFNYWDRLMGTNQPAYESRFRLITAPHPASREPVEEVVAHDPMR